jgi:hypothetical protein
MTRTTRRLRVAELLAPTLAPGEELVMTGAAWYAVVPEGRRRLFAGRHYHLVALTSARVVVWSRRAHPHRHSTPRLDAPLGSLRVERGRDTVLLQVLARADDGSTHVLEFRPSERALGRALARAHTG